jgi:ATP-dependent RNA helicase RhlE
MSEQKETTQESVYYDQRSVALRTTQSIYFVANHDKASLLGLVLKAYKALQIVIVVKSKKKADELSKTLTEQDFHTRAVHGNHRQSQQQEVAKSFNLGDIHVLISTDMILPTLELKNIKLLLSYDLPDMPQVYYNRLALMKEQGEAVAFVSDEDEPFLNDIEYNMKKEIEEKVLEGFVATPKPKKAKNSKKDRTKKPRHSKRKVQREEGV